VRVGESDDLALFTAVSTSSVILASDPVPNPEQSYLSNEDWFDTLLNIASAPPNRRNNLFSFFSSDSGVPPSVYWD
jgi:hypothetical protein